jgi:ABC-type transporter Mla MlaB component
MDRSANRRRVLDCDVRHARADAVTLEALARLQLAASRRGIRLRLRHPSRELLDLVELAGLADVLR